MSFVYGNEKEGCFFIWAQLNVFRTLKPSGRAALDVALLHRGTETLTESKTYLKALPYFNRLDLVLILCQEHTYALVIENLLNVVIPRRSPYSISE